MPITFTQPIRHDGDRLHLALSPPCCRPPCPWELSIGTFNIRNRPVFRISQAIQVVQIGGFYLMILADTKINNQAYFHNRMGYYVVFLTDITTDAGRAQGGWY